MQITVKDRQTLLDISVQYLGGADGVFALAVRNGISITDRLKDGQVLEYETSDMVDAGTATLYALRGIEPATDIPQEEATELLAATGRYFTGCIIPPFRFFDWDNDGDKVLNTVGRQFENGTAATLTEEQKPLDTSRLPRLREDIKAGRPIKSETGKTLARIFSNPFNDVFA